MGSPKRPLAAISTLLISLKKNSMEIFEFLAVFCLTCFQPTAFHLFGKLGPVSIEAFIFGIPSAVSMAYIFWLILNRDKNWRLQTTGHKSEHSKFAKRLGEIVLGFLLCGLTWIFSQAARGWLSDLPKETSYWSPEYYQSIASVPGFVFLSLILTGVHVISEEIVFRAYFIHKLKKVCHGNLLLAVIFSSILFSLKNGYGYKGSIETFLSGVIFAIAYVSTGSLLPSVTAHWLINFMALAHHTK